jgi:hypothetical protein
MFGLFSRRLPVDDEELEFQLATFKWLREEFRWAAGNALATPDRLPSLTRDGAGPGDLLDDLCRTANMADWPVSLSAGEGPTDWTSPCGALRLNGVGLEARAFVTRNVDSRRDPGALAARIAHALGHFLLLTASRPGPGGLDLVELQSDLAAVHLGFGLVMANQAKRMVKYVGRSRPGLATELRAQLNEGALVTALVISERLAGRDPLAAVPYLKDYLRKDLKRAARALARRHPDMAAAVDAVDLATYGCA